MHSLILLLHLSVISVSGKLVNGRGEPVPFASISMLSTKDSTSVSGLSDENGQFSINVSVQGSYVFQATSVGYRPFAYTVNIGDQPTAVLANLTMTEETRELNEVSVRTARAPVEQLPDRTVINLENNVLTKGSSVLEILERTPGIVRDQRSNTLLLNGKTGVQIMLDGKPVR